MNFQSVKPDFYVIFKVFVYFRFVLFKKHYDKYLHLSQKYEEARNIAYYLEEKYHEIKVGYLLCPNSGL